MSNRFKLLQIALIIVALFGLGVGFKYVSKGGLLSVDLPKPAPLGIDHQSELSPNSAKASSLKTDELQSYENPLNDIYVNPFE